jgi:DME family drug/metabolite transporter
MLNNKSLSILAVILAATLWGTTGTIQALIPEYKEPLVVGAIRLYLAAIYLFLISIFFDKNLFSAIFKSPVLIAFSGLFMMLYNMTFFAAVLISGVGVGTAITIGSAPIWAILFEFIILKSTHGFNKLIGAILAVTGICVLMLFDDNTDWSNLGAFLALLSGLSYALYSLSTSRIVKKLSHHNTAAWTFLIAAFFSTPVFIYFPSSWVFAHDAIYHLIFLGMFATGIAYSFFTFGLKYLTSSTAVMLSLVEPIIAVILAIIILGEFFSMSQYLAIMVIIIGLYFTSKSEAD